MFKLACGHREAGLILYGHNQFTRAIIKILCGLIVQGAYLLVFTLCATLYRHLTVVSTLCVSYGDDHKDAPCSDGINKVFI